MFRKRKGWSPCISAGHSDDQCESNNSSAIFPRRRKGTLIWSEVRRWLKRCWSFLSRLETAVVFFTSCRHSSSELAYCLSFPVGWWIRLEVCVADPLVPAVKSPFSQLPSSEPEASSCHRALELCFIFSAVKVMVTRRNALRNCAQIIYWEYICVHSVLHLNVKFSHLTTRGAR